MTVTDHVIPRFIRGDLFFIREQATGAFSD